MPSLIYYLDAYVLQVNILKAYAITYILILVCITLVPENAYFHSYITWLHIYDKCPSKYTGLHSYICYATKSYKESFLKVHILLVYIQVHNVSIGWLHAHTCSSNCPNSFSYLMFRGWTTQVQIFSLIKQPTWPNLLISFTLC
jgi:hypothetical protein